MQWLNVNFINLNNFYNINYRKKKPCLFILLFSKSSKNLITKRSFYIDVFHFKIWVIFLLRLFEATEQDVQKKNL